MLGYRLLAPEGEAAGGGGSTTPEGGAPSDGESPAPTMDDTIRETYRSLMEGGADEADDGASGGDEHAAQGRTRGADGRFSKAAGDQPGEQSGDGQQQEQQQGEQPGEGQQPQAKPHDAYPNTWRRELSAEWQKLPESVREEIHRRETDFHNGIKQYREAATFGQGIAQEMLPYQQIMREKGVQPRAIVRDIMGALNTMATGSDEAKATTFLQLARDYGINLDTVLSLRQRAPAGVAPEIAPVLQRVQQLETTLSTQAQEREQAQRAEDEAIVQRFINDPKNEHAKTVAKEMSALLISGQAADLQDAYQQACWLNPQVRAALLKKQEDERRVREAAEAAAAKKAAAANVTRRGTPPATPKPGTMDDTIRSNYRRLMGSG